MKKKKRKELTEEEMRRNAERILASMEHWNDDRRDKPIDCSSCNMHANHSKSLIFDTTDLVLLIAGVAMLLFVLLLR